MLAVADNLGNIIAPLVVKPVNIHDNLLFEASFSGLLEMADLFGWDLRGSYVTLDSGFDCAINRGEIEREEIIPVIKPNLRGMKNQAKINQKLDEFEPLKDIYNERYKIERCYAWEDVYRKTVTRYEKLQCTHLGFKYLAFSMINLRWFIGKNRSYSL